MHDITTETIVSLAAVRYPTVTALWTDGKTRLHDLTVLIKDLANHPALHKLADPLVFNTVSVEYGSLAWTSLKFVEDHELNMDFTDNYFSPSPSMLYRDGVVISTFKPQHRLAKVIKDLRQKYQLTQEQLALKVGMQKTYISRIERGLTDINYGTFEWILEVGFGKTLDVVDQGPENSMLNWVKVGEDKLTPT